MGGRFGAFQFGPEGVRVEFDNSFSSGKETTQEQVAEAQPELEQEFNSLEERAVEQPAAQTPAPLDVTGSWLGNNGFTYFFQQYGSYVVFQEQSAAYGTTGVGEGTIEGDYLYLEFQGIDGTTGSVQLTYREGVLSGTFSNSYVTNEPITMTQL